MLHDLLRHLNLNKGWHFLCYLVDGIIVELRIC
jgi:hypothetical protein